MILCIRSKMRGFLKATVAAVAACGVSITALSPPVWPDQLHAILLQDRDGELADVDLYYDWPGGRNLNIIKSRSDGSVLYDNERNNGRSVVTPQGSDSASCDSIDGCA
jgi:hypothetical protein